MLENLWDEEHGDENHLDALAALLRVARPGRRARFAPASLTPRRASWSKASAPPAPRAASPRASRPSTPTSRRRREVAETKIAGLKKFYGFEDERATPSSASTRSVDLLSLRGGARRRRCCGDDDGRARRLGGGDSSRPPTVFGASSTGHTPALQLSREKTRSSGWR